MIFGNPDFATYFIMNPITWIILIMGCPPIFYYENKLLHKAISKYFPDDTSQRSSA